MSSKTPAPFEHPAFQGRIGVARREITAPVGIHARNWGAAKHDACEGVHRPLFVTALVLQADGGGEPLALLALDLIHGGDLDNPLVTAARGALGLNASRVMLAFSHTHAGPRWEPSGEDVPGAELVPAYGRWLAEQVAEAAREARANLQPATLEFHYGRCGLATNRDLPDPAAARLLTGFHPAGEADDTLLVGRASGDDGRVLATLVNYACHPTTFAWQNRLLSPDWVGAMREVVEGATGGAPCVFLQGASGELAPREQYTGDPEIVDRNGRQVGHAAAAALEDMLPPRKRLVFDGVVESGAPLAAWRRETCEPSRALEAGQLDLELPIKPDLPGAHEIEAQMRRTEDRALRERLRRKLALRKRLGEGSSFRAPVWVWRVGDAVLVGQINEAYSAFQRSLRASFPQRAIAVMNVVNGSMGYLPPRELYVHDLYTVWQTPFAAGSLERLVEAGSAAVGKMVNGGGQR
ncbi:MAG: hypothetical protein M5U26_20430 [Planctomycetota bacterium]|nr:hypothetical protein [Planctomycetota bacterium]